MTGPDDDEREDRGAGERDPPDDDQHADRETGESEPPADERDGQSATGNRRADAPSRAPESGQAAVDPVQEAFGGEVDLQEIATWEARTRLDRFAIRLANALESTRRWLLLIVAVALFGGQLVVAAALVAEAPVLGYLAVLSALPALGLAGYFWYGDPTTREPFVTLAATFLLGVVFASIAGVVNSLTEPFFGLFGIVGLTLFYFLVVGPIEETVKWLAVRVYAYRSAAFRTVVDGVVYGAMAGVGFAAIENLLYIVIFAVEQTPTGLQVQQDSAISIATQRAFVGPGHVIFSAWAGFYLGLARFNRSKRGPIVVKGLLIAAFVHGLYNTLVSTLPLTLGTFLVFLLVYHGFWFILLYRKIRRYRELYRRRPGTG